MLHDRLGVFLIWSCSIKLLKNERSCQHSHSVQLPLAAWAGGGAGLNLLPNFQKWGAEQNLRGGLLGKSRVTIFNDKKKLISKDVFPSHNQEFKLVNFN